MDADGLVVAWNAEKPTFRMREGDRIGRLNGEEGRAGRLIELMKGSEGAALELDVSRSRQSK